MTKTKSETLKDVEKMDAVSDLVSERTVEDVNDPIEFMNTLIKPGFARNWKSEYGDRNEQRLAEYLKREILEAYEEGYSVLSCVLSLSVKNEVVPKTIALRLLHSDYDISPLFLRKPIFLKLIPKQYRPSPLPIHDYNGCLIPMAKRGKVLAAKVCCIGEKDIESQGSSKSAETIRELRYTAPQFEANQSNAKKFYRDKQAPYFCEEITDSPKMFQLDEAISILSRYGFGIAKTRLNKDQTNLWFVQEHIVKEE